MSNLIFSLLPQKMARAETSLNPDLLGGERIRVRLVRGRHDQGEAGGVPGEIRRFACGPHHAGALPGGRVEFRRHVKGACRGHGAHAALEGDLLNEGRGVRARRQGRIRFVGRCGEDHREPGARLSR